MTFPLSAVPTDGAAVPVYCVPKAVHPRPRGFIDWKPRAAALSLVGNVQAVLDEYQDHLPLTLRQIFYRLVGAYQFPKTEKDYDRLTEVMGKARRSRMIPFSAIRDDGFHNSGWHGYATIDQAKRSLQAAAKHYRIDRQRGQPVRLAVWCEATGMVPQLERVCTPYSVPVYSSGGFDSLTVKYNMARKFAGIGAVRILHLGDHDPSGVHVFGSLDEDIRAFIQELGGKTEFIRLAVLPEHIDRYRLDTAPAKDSDRRAFTGDTVQAEALPPDVLADILDSAVQKNMDMAIYRQAVNEEETERSALVTWLSGVQA